MAREIYNCFQPLERRTLLAHVGLDLGFGDAGYANVSGSLLVAPVKGGKVLAVGPNGAVRLNSDGSIDTTFRDRGARSEIEQTPQVASVSGQRFYIGGTTLTPPQGDQQDLVLYVRKANLSTGVPDASFGDAGVATFLPNLATPDFSPYAQLGDIAVAPDGGVLVPVFGSYVGDLVVYKLTSTGQLDMAFGDAGAAPVNVNTETDNHAPGSGRLVVYPDGDYVIVTGDDSQHGLYRFHADGSPDTSFGTQGVVSLFGGNTHNIDLFLQNDGKIVLTFDTADISGRPIRGHIHRYNPDGTPDTSFGDGGAFDGFGFDGITLDSAGRFVGLSKDNDLFRLTPAGVLDTSFDDDGLSAVPDTVGGPPPHPDEFYGFSLNAAADASGNLLLARTTDVTRYVERDRAALASDGRLYIDGTDGADTIVAGLSGDSIGVTLNGESSTFAAGDVKAFVITAANGSDSVDLAVDRDALVNGDDGDDSIRTAVGADLITAGRGKDTVDSGAGNDVIFGGDGDDELYASDGNDRVFGEYGEDSISGGAGNDRLYGGHSYYIFEGEYDEADYGADSISGGAGNDRCDGQFGDDRVAGNGGRDKLFGDSGDDRLYGGAAGDWLYGELGADRLFGGDGLDRLYDFDGVTDTLHGDAGDDVLISNDDVLDYLFGDTGHDFANADAADELTSIEALA